MVKIDLAIRIDDLAQELYGYKNWHEVSEITRDHYRRLAQKSLDHIKKQIYKFEADQEDSLFKRGENSCH